MSKVIKNFIKAFDAGFLIGLATITYLQCENKYLGAFLFGIGLFIICCYELKLCTGMFGYVWETGEDLIGPTLGNILGVLICFIAARLFNPRIVELAHAALSVRLDRSIPQVLVSGIFCGILIFLAVDIFKYGARSFTKALGIFICVPVFVINGFDHCVVTMFYACSSATLLEVGLAILRVCVILAGNFVGAIATCFLIRHVNIRLVPKEQSNETDKT